MQHPTVRQPKRIRVAGVPNLYQRPKDGKYEAGFTGPDGKWHMRTLKARTLTEAKREQRVLAVRNDRGEEVAPSRRTLQQVAEEFLASFEALVAVGERGERTLARYRGDLERHILPALGRYEIQKITPDLLARFLAEKRASGLASWTCRGLLTPLGRIFSLAVRRNYISENPLNRLDSSELPKGQSKDDPRVLTRDELSLLLAQTAANYLPVIATLVYTGMRMQECLGLVWDDVDFDTGLIRVRSQLSRATRKQPARRIRLKTKKSRREIRLESDLAALLKKHKTNAFALGRSRPESYVFTTAEGTPLYHRNVATRGLTKAAEAASLNPTGKPKLTPHDLRHTYGSHLILNGLDVVRVSRQLGHATPTITLSIYAHEFEQVQHAGDVDAKLTAAFGGIL